MTPSFAPLAEIGQASDITLLALALGLAMGVGLGVVGLDALMGRLQRRRRRRPR